MWLLTAMCAMNLSRTAAAAEHVGQVTFTGLPVPGASVTATRDGQPAVVTSTDPQGYYRLVNLSDGTWRVRVEMAGFAPLVRDVTVVADAPAASWELALLPFDQITAVRLRPGTEPAPAATARGSAGGGGETSAVSGSSRIAPADPAGPDRARPTEAAPPASGDELAAQAADGFLINGSVNNGAASPFAQLAAFGNNRRTGRSVYNGGIGVIAGDSAWDARPYSFTSQRAPRADYTDLQMLATVGGPLRIPRLLRNGPNTFAGYQRTADTSASTSSSLMPTLLERAGDFSQSGRQVIDPQTGLPFPGNRVPRNRISPQAAALLGYYPQPNVDAEGYNFQAPVLTATRQDSVQSRLTQTLTPRTQLFGTFSYQRTATDTRSIFAFDDTTVASGVDGSATWSRRFSQFYTLRLRYQFTRLTTTVTPYFANRINVSGAAGIAGNNQEPVNWGPPSLVFASGIAGLSDAQHAFTQSDTNGVSTEQFLARGRHSLTFGGGARAQAIDVRSQQDPRGTLAFTGAATGSDFADFLLGLPHTSSIAFGNADKYFGSASYEAFLADDWRLSPGLTINAGIRWEYEAPMRERLGRLVNLSIASGFTAVTPVVADDGLLRPDLGGLQPRVGLAWRPIPGSSLVVRAGYGIYRNTAVYQSIATMLAQQPPLSRAYSVQSTAITPLTLANAFLVTPASTANTFAVDPDFRVGYAHTWQTSVQRDLPASLTVIASYLGSQGSRLMQQVLPNTYPAGAASPCSPATQLPSHPATCPSGFVYLTSNGESLRNAAQLQLRRRLRNGLTASVQYTLAKAEDDAAAFAGANVSGAAIAQDWRDLDAEWGPSNFDQRHLVVAQFQYTTGVGVAGGPLLDGLRGALVKGWTVTTELRTGSGLPLTPAVLSPVSGTGVVGSIRPDRVGGQYVPPPSGRWGTAGRNSITGPSQFSLNAGVARTFPWGNRINVDWRVDALNVLNRVTYAGLNTIVGSPQFGLPNRANPMRKLQTTMRLRF
jgi:hypothetical protein